MTPVSLGPDYFERMYSANADLWNFACSEYEHTKYDATLAALGTASFRSALEIGCSIGVLTSRLANRCENLLAVDINTRALRQARARCAARTHVRFARMHVPREFPETRFDLVVVSEVGYYWDDDDLQQAIDRIASVARGGVVELVHYLPRVPEYIRDGDSVHAAFLADSRFRCTYGERAERFRIDVLSVA